MISEFIPAITKEIEVPLDPTAAFELFSREIGKWWPVHTHSVTRSSTALVRLECHKGGRLEEVAEDGTVQLWGRVTLWQPPRALAFTWHPGRPDSTHQEVEVRFLPSSAGTRVRLEHRGWERLAAHGEGMRENYDLGWNAVLDRLFAAASS